MKYLARLTEITSLHLFSCNSWFKLKLHRLQDETQAKNKIYLRFIKH